MCILDTDFFVEYMHVKYLDPGWLSDSINIWLEFGKS